MKTSSAKAKGRRWQQRICTYISELLNIPWGKDEEIASREMGQSGTDVRLSPRVRKMFPFSVECKNTERWNVPAYVKQARENRLPETDWVLFLSRNREKGVAVIDIELFFDLLSCIGKGDYIDEFIKDRYKE